MRFVRLDRGPGVDVNRVTPASRRVLGVAGLLVVIQLVLRTWVAARGNFYWDDLILTGRSGSMPLLSTEFLLHDHDGHFMPAAFLVAGLVTKAAPLQWIGPVVSLVVLQALASLSVLRLLRLVMGDRVALLGPFLFYLFSPLTLPSFAWWSAALNDVPLQMGLAWVAGDAIQLVRTGNRRYAVTGVLVFTVTLAFFEKAVVVPWVAFAVAALVLHTQDHSAAIRTVARRGAPLWRGALYVTCGWLLLYTSVVSSRAAEYGVGQAVALTSRGFGLGFAPSLLGGPWSWDRSNLSIPWADPRAFSSLSACSAAGGRRAYGPPQAACWWCLAARGRLRRREPGSHGVGSFRTLHGTGAGPVPSVRGGQRRGRCGRGGADPVCPRPFEQDSWWQVAGPLGERALRDGPGGRGRLPGQQPGLDGDLHQILVTHPHGHLPRDRTSVSSRQPGRTPA